MWSRRAWLQAAGAGAASALAGCTLQPDRDHAGANAPRAQALARAPRVAWVLGSGGPRGFVHVGVIKGLAELGLKPDLIVGASVGSVVGSLCAAGLSAGALEALALDVPAWSLARWAVGSEERWSGAAVAERVRRESPVALLEDMPCAMACVATRLSDGVPVAFTAGDVGLAVQASAAIEGEFAPVRIRGERYVDPDGLTPLPVRVARALGAQRVLAVDASAHLDRVPPGAERYRESDLRKKALIDREVPLADWVLKPDFGYWAGISHEYRVRVIEAGYRATLAQARELERLHAL